MKQFAIFLCLFSSVAVHAQDTGPHATTYPATDTAPAGISLNYRNQEIREILRALGLAAGVNIIADRDVEGIVTTYLTKVSLEDALDAITIPNGFTWEREGNLIRVRKVRENPFFRVRAGKITVHSDNIPIGTFLDAAAKASGLNFVTTDPIQVNITAHLTEQPIQEGLIQALRNNGLLVTPEGSVFKVSPAKPPVTVERDENYKLTIDARGADIRSIFTALARATEENIILDVDVSVPNVTFYVTRTTFSDALSAITATYGLAWQKLGEFYRVYRPQAGVQLPVSIDENGRISFDLRGAELGEIVRQIATRMGWNVVFHVGLSEKVNQRIDRLPISSVMEKLFENTPYAWVLDTSPTGTLILTVGNPAVGSREAGLFLREKSYPFQYVKAADAVPFLPREVPSSNIRIHPDQNAMVLLGTPLMHRMMAPFVELYDTIPPQIAIEMLVVEINREKAKNLGIGAITGQEGEIVGAFNPSGAPTVSFTFTNGLNLGPTFSASLTALERKGIVKVHANPTVLVKSGLPASIVVTREDNFQLVAPSATPNVPIIQIQKIPSGITLNVTPWTGIEGGVIHLNINAEVSSASSQISSTQLPSVSARRANTQVVLRDGQTIILGGLIQGRENDAKDGVPFLGDLPIIGHLFGSRSRSNSTTELIFYITPRLINVGTGIDRTLSDTSALTLSTR